ncbi:MAG: hypothetical protein WD871_01705 [Xanthobacteraceae bacterium]
MIWQDAVIATVQLGFCAALVPTAMPAADKPPLATSAPTAIGLFVIAATMASLGLWWSFTTAGASGALWAVIAFQRWSARQ